MVIFWQKKDSSKKHYNKPDTVPRSWYLLTGLEANTSYEIQVQVMSDGSSVPISDPAFATTHAEGKLKKKIRYVIQLNLDNFNFRCS